MKKHSIEWNKDLWNNTAYIPSDGEGWSNEFGGSNSQWFNIIRPRLNKCLPSRTVLEIACGWGRWTKFLLNETQEYFGFDISKPGIESCQNRYLFEVSNNKANFYLNDGKSLSQIQDNSIDFIFSFDSLVHVNMDAIESYLTEAQRVLTDKGRMFIHHSNMMEYEKVLDVHDVTNNPHGRSPYVNAKGVNTLAKNIGLNIVSQEKICWQSSVLNDCFTMLSKGTEFEEKSFDNWGFREEISIAKKLNDLYQ